MAFFILLRQIRNKVIIKKNKYFALFSSIYEEEESDYQNAVSHQQDR